MATELLPGRIEEEVEIERVDKDPFKDNQGTETPPMFGRCPVCNKPLFPVDRITGQPKAPPVGTGFESRAICKGCGAIIVYMGGGNWRVLTEGDLSEQDHNADSFDRLFQGGE